MEVPEQLVGKVLVTIGLLWALRIVYRLYRALFLNPRRLSSILEKQGIRGPPRSFLLGNLAEMLKAKSALPKRPPGEKGIVHDCPTALFPAFQKWIKEYGPIFKFSIGNLQFLHINDPEVVKELCLCTSLEFGKPTFPKKLFDPLLGEGIVNANGAVWSQQRKIIAPEFFNEKVKGMTKLIVASATAVVDKLASEIEREGGVADVNVEHHITKFATEVISRLCFGSNYSSGEEIFSKLRVLGDITSKTGTINALFPFMRYIPTKSNRESNKLEKEVRRLILKLVKERSRTETQKDILQLIFEGARNMGLDRNAADRYIVDNCRNIYVAGYETTAASAMWTLMLLAINPDWQDRVRQEVLEICQGQTPDAEMIRKMKVLTMVIYESLRLYPPGPILSREALEDLKFGNIHVPKGLNVWTLFLSLHYEPEIWGPDAQVFNPERFANGVSGSCKYPHAYMPFGAGSRICLGQNFAMAELRILLSLILSNFSFSMSPKYQHSPILKVIMKPEFGMNLIIRRT